MISLLCRWHNYQHVDISRWDISDVTSWQMSRVAYRTEMLLCWIRWHVSVVNYYLGTQHWVSTILTVVCLSMCASEMTHRYDLHDITRDVIWRSRILMNMSILSDACSIAVCIMTVTGVYRRYSPRDVVEPTTSLNASTKIAAPRIASSCNTLSSRDLVLWRYLSN